MNTSFLRGTRPTGVALAALCIVSAAAAQPTGNPKGTVTPPETSAPKPNSARVHRNENTMQTESGKLTGTEAQTRARMQTGASPGSGTEGGLPRKQSGNPSGENNTRSAKGSAAPRPEPSSK